MLVHAQTDGLVLVVIHLVQVPQHDVSNQKQTAAAAFHFIQMNCELTLIALCLMEVQRRFQLEHNIVHLEAHRRQICSHFLTFFHHEAEVIIVDAVHFWNSVLPFLFQKGKDVGRHPDVVSSCVDNSWYFLLFEFFSCRPGGWHILLVSVIGSLALESPLLDRLSPFRSVSKCLHFLESFDASHNLVFINASENSVRRDILIWASSAEADDGLVYQSFLFKVPHKIEISFFFVRVNCQTKNSVDFVDAVGLIKGHKIHLRASIVFSFNTDCILI